MGILDDLAMGFGLKKRTEDYDARTARNIAETQAFGDDHVSAMRARQGYVSTGPRGRDYAAEYRAAYNDPSGRAQQFLGSRGRDNYNPQISDDNRPFMQRLMTSPTGAPSPTPYAIGPISMDQPLPSFGIFGLLSSLSNFNRKNVPTVSADTSPMRVRPQSGYNMGGNAQPGTRFDTRTEAEPIDFSDGILVEDPATIAAKEALLSTPDVYDPSGDFGLRGAPVSLLDTPSLDPELTLITSGPHAGKYVDRNGRLRMP
jgi:hypothetical protein